MAYEYEDGTAYMVFGCQNSNYKRHKSWPIVCFLKKDEAMELCALGNALIETIQKLGSEYDVDAANEAFLQICEISEKWEDTKYHIRDTGNYSHFFYYEKAPLHKTSTVIAKTEVVSEPGAPFKVEKITLTPEHEVRLRKPYKVNLPGVKR